MSRVTNMTSGNPTKLMLTFSLPLMIGNIGQQLYTVVDAIIVGQGVGVQALAALGATDWIYWLVLWSITSFAQGFSILITQRFGAGDRAGVRKAIAMSVVLCVAISAVVTVLSLLAAKPLLTVLQTPDDIFGGALAYVLTLYAGTGIVLAYNMAASILRSFGNGRSPLVAMFIAAFINIGLDLLFVMVFGWGIVGAAVATLIAQLVAFLYCLLVLRKIPEAQLTREDWRLDRADLKQLWGLGAPLAFQHAIITVGGMILQSVINGYGFLFVAGFTATNKLYGMLESTAIAFGYATSTYMGQNRGAGKIERIDSGMKSVVKLSVLVSVGISLFMIVFGRNILQLFISREAENAAQVLRISYGYLVVMSSFLAALYLLHTYRSALQGLGNTIASFWSGVIEFIMRIAAAFIMPVFLGESGLFFAEPAAWIGAAVFLIFSYYREVERVKQQMITENLQRAEAEKTAKA